MKCFLKSVDIWDIVEQNFVQPTNFMTLTEVEQREVNHIHFKDDQATHHIFQ